MKVCNNPLSRVWRLLSVIVILALPLAAVTACAESKPRPANSPSAVPSPSNAIASLPEPTRESTTSSLSPISPISPPPEPTSKSPTSPLSTPTVAGETPIYTYRIVAVYPHDPTAFTQGLVFENGWLYEGTGLRGNSTLRRVKLETGEVQQRYDLPNRFFGEGISIFGDRIFQLTWQSHVGFVYDKASFELLQEFQYPTEGWGLTHDGDRLIMSDGTDALFFLDPITLQETDRLQVRDGSRPVTRLNELEYIQGEVYANIWQTDRIGRIAPQSGQVTGWIDLSGLLDSTGYSGPADVLNGIAYDAENDRLFVTGKLWPSLFEIELVRER